MASVNLNDKTNDQLDDLNEKRVDEKALIYQKQSIVAELIDKAHKREVKK